MDLGVLRGAPSDWRDLRPSIGGELAAAIAIFGANASTDAIRRKARCSVCGGKGQSAINLPSFVSVTEGWQKYPRR